MVWDPFLYVANYKAGSQYKAWHWWGFRVALAAYGVGDRTEESPICSLNANLVGGGLQELRLLGLKR